MGLYKWSVVNLLLFNNKTSCIIEIFVAIIYQVLNVIDQVRCLF